MNDQALVALGNEQCRVIGEVPSEHITYAALDWRKKWLEQPGPALALVAYHDAHLINRCGQSWLDRMKAAMNEPQIRDSGVEPYDGREDDDEDFIAEDDHFEERETFGCCFPDKCVIPGEHFPSECCTAEEMEAIMREGEEGK